MPRWRSGWCTRADQHAGCCGGWGLNTPAYPIGQRSQTSAALPGRRFHLGRSIFPRRHCQWCRAADRRCRFRRLAIHQRHKLEHLCRYIARPAIANERLAFNQAGQVVLTLKTPYRDGTTHIVMEPLEFMQRLAALVPRPRLHLIRFHGVLAPNAKLRPAIIPSRDANPAALDQAESPYSSPLARMSWARLLKRVFHIDLEHCPNCGGTLTIIAALLDPTAIAHILTGLSARAPPRRPRSDDLLATA